MTRVTLRQAHKLVDKIVAKMRTLTVEPTARVNLWDQEDAEVIMAQHRTKFEEQVSRQIALTHARQSIRDAVLIANREQVDRLVSKRKALLDQIGIYRTIVDSTDVDRITTGTALAQKLAASRQAAGSGGSSTMFGGDTVIVSRVTEERREQLEQLINLMQLSVEQVEDELTQANATGNIQLSDAVVDLLRKEGLIT